MGARFAPAVQEEALDQIGPKLGADYVRFVVSWADAQPTDQATYDETYLAGVDNAVTLAKARGVKVMITFAYVPRWASDSRFWNTNQFTPKGYDRRYAMKTDSTTLSAFQEFCRAMALRWQGVWGYECWNEPNLHFTLYPQSTPSGQGLRRPRLHQDAEEVLRRHPPGRPPGQAPGRRHGPARLQGHGTAEPSPHDDVAAAVRRGRSRPPGSPRTSTDTPIMRTRPAPRRTTNRRRAPRDPKTTVNLQNLPVLLKVFPTKSFYITEYGYQTAPCYSFSQQYVSFAQQAKYLTRAYAYAARFRQVKLLMWFMLDDFSLTGRPD